MPTVAGHNTSSVPLGVVSPSSLDGLWSLTGAFSLSLTTCSFLNVPVAGTFFGFEVLGPLAGATIEEVVVVKLILDQICGEAMDAGKIWSKFSDRIEVSCDSLT